MVDLDQNLVIADVSVFDPVLPIKHKFGLVGQIYDRELVQEVFVLAIDITDLSLDSCLEKINFQKNQKKKFLKKLQKNRIYKHYKF